MKIVVTNMSGNAGKTTLRKHLFGPLMPDANLITIEDMNDGDGPVREELEARDFRQLAIELNTADTDSNYVLDIGSSSLREALQHFKTLRTTRDVIDFWVLPCCPTIKQRNDTVQTIKLLLEMGISAHQIRIIPNAVEDFREADIIFAPIREKAREIGYQVCPVPVLWSDIFQMLKDRPASVFDVAANRTDFRTEVQRMKGDPAALEGLGRAMVARDLAEDAAHNLREVFSNLNLHQSRGAHV